MSVRTFLEIEYFVPVLWHPDGETRVVTVHGTAHIAQTKRGAQNIIDRNPDLEGATVEKMVIRIERPPA